MDGPEVRVSPTAFGGEPTLGIYPTQIIADLYRGGDDVETTYRLTRQELIVALWFEALYGQERFRQWSVWAKYVQGELRRPDGLPSESLPLPPR